MIRRERDVELVNELVRRDFPELDFSEFLAESLHVCLIDGDSGALFAWRGPGIYEVHVFFAVRGRAALDLGHAMLAMMRAMGGRMFWAFVPIESRQVRVFTRLMGWKSHGIIETRHGPNELFVQED